MTKFERSHPLQKFIYTPGRSYFKKERGPFAGLPFEQLSMRGLMEVPRPISGGAGWVGSRWAGIWKGRLYGISNTPLHSNNC